MHVTQKELQTLKEFAATCDFELNEYQKDPTEHWLLSDENKLKGTGRTSFLILLALSRALTAPGKAILFEDHGWASSWSVLHDSMPTIHALLKNCAKNCTNDSFMDMTYWDISFKNSTITFNYK